MAAGCIRSVLEDLNVFDQIPRVKLETSRIIEVSPYTVPQYYNDLMTLGLSMYGSAFWSERDLHSACLRRARAFPALTFPSFTAHAFGAMLQAPSPRVSNLVELTKHKSAVGLLLDVFILDFFCFFLPRLFH